MTCRLTVLPSGSEMNCVVVTESPADGAASSVSHRSWMARKASRACDRLGGVRLGEQLLAVGRRRRSGSTGSARGAVGGGGRVVRRVAISGVMAPLDHRAIVAHRRRPVPGPRWREAPIAGPWRGAARRGPPEQLLGRDVVARSSRPRPRWRSGCSRPRLSSLLTSATTASMRPLSRSSTMDCSALPHRTTN